MKNINIKISRDFVLVLGLVSLLFIPWNIVQADLNKEFRENFTEFTQNQCFNSISYSVDDITGFEKNEENEWDCADLKDDNGSIIAKAKCKEYQETVNCLFDDAFEQAINQTNRTVKKYSNQDFAGLRDKNIRNSKTCGKTTLKNIQEQQESLGFKSDCSGDFAKNYYSSCRVTETVLNELCGYENFLTAKSKDAISFSRENFEYDEYKNEVLISLANAKQQYIREIDKSQQAFINTVLLYKNFIHNYRIHAWLVAIKDKLKNISQDWKKIHQALETFPNKFIDSNSTE